MDFRFILINKETDGTATVTFNRPEVLNALNSEVFKELASACSELEQDPEVKVVLITGGEKVFAAGADIKEMLNLEAVEVLKFGVNAHNAVNTLAAMTKPTIAVINGYALGGGMEVALACDFRVASEGAKMGLPEITLGIYPGAGGTQRLPRLVGASRAKEMILTGEMIDAAKAYEWGILNCLAKNGEAMDEAKKLAAKLTSKGAVALQLAKSVIDSGLEMDLHSALTQERQIFALLFATEDRKEGMQAFVEKRKPNFKDR